MHRGVAMRINEEALHWEHSVPFDLAGNTPFSLSIY